MLSSAVAILSVADSKGAGKGGGGHPPIGSIFSPKIRLFRVKGL